MKPAETILIAILVIAAFIVTDVVVDAVTGAGAAARLIMRIGLLAQDFALIYLYFDARDTARRLRELEGRSGCREEDYDDDVT